MKRIRVAGLVVVIVLTVVALQAAVAAYEPEGPLAEESKFWIDPPSISVDEGETFTVTAMVEGVQDMVGYRLKMDWDGSVVSVTNVTDAGFLLEEPEFEDLKLSQETFSFQVAVLPPYEDGADGSGALAVITLEAVGTGSSPLHLDQTKVEWVDAEEVVHDAPAVGDGRVAVGLDFSVYLPLTSKNYGP